ncbi:pentatricopeptide repeat-containing protein At2g27610-like [Castanea sativa]|uniref:pentatricopeptide repeat-containing protein At2g27610-like n=1 Tax=Castanea sativa TaxID=21020 RepID=UPI003F64FB13
MPDQSEGKLKQTIFTLHITTREAFLQCAPKYTSCGDIEAARKEFDVLPQGGIDAWNAMIIAYSRQKYPDEVLNLYHQMILKGVRTDNDNLTFMAALKVSKWDDVASVRRIMKKERDEESVKLLDMSQIKTEFLLHSFDEEVKEKMLCNHIEWLAIAFGLLNTRPGTRLLIIKNPKVCGNFHEATKFITKIVNREIVVRDVKQFHHFKKGICSSGDYCEADVRRFPFSLLDFSQLRC